MKQSNAQEARCDLDKTKKTKKNNSPYFVKCLMSQAI